MCRRGVLLVLVVVLPSLAMGLELVTNGDFEDDLGDPWRTTLVGASANVSRATGWDGDPNFEVLAEKGTGNGSATLSQTVVVPSPDLELSVSAKVVVSASTGGPWAAAGVALHYEDVLGDLLGTTVIAGTTPDCPWADTDTFHLIAVADSEWHDYAFEVAGELGNLPGVDMAAVHQIRISLFGQVGGDC